MVWLYHPCMVFNKEKFTSRKIEEKINYKEASNQLKELAKITKAKEMTKLREGNIILKQLRNLNV